MKFERIDFASFVSGFLDYCDNVAGLARRTLDRYRAALQHFQDFALVRSLGSVDHVNETTVEEFVKWLRKQTRGRNGADCGKQDGYTPAGIKFILATCRTAMSWARKHRHLPPYAENPFSVFPLDKLRDRTQGAAQDMLTREQAQAFLRTSDSWQRPIFLVLAAYGLRVGELTHLLIEDVDFEEQVLYVRSKPDLFWHVKTSRQRVLPVFPEIRPVFERAIGNRRAGFVFLNRPFAKGRQKPSAMFADPQAFKRHVVRLAEEARSRGVSAERDVSRVVSTFLRSMGQIPEKRVRQEFMKITKKIGCPELTRAHSLRHLFATQAQERGMNPFLVQDLLGHSTLSMTSRYTHLGLETQREALGKMFRQAKLSGLVKQVKGPKDSA